MVMNLARHLGTLMAFALLPYGALAQPANAPDQKKPAVPGLPPAGTIAKPAPAQPIYPPNAVDLKAAYCRPVVAASTAEHQRTMDAGLPPNLQQAAKERLASAVDRGRRIEFYLLPRLPMLQSAALLDAQARGYTDVASAQEFARNCDARCSGINDAAAAAACRQRCRDGNEAAKRTRECDDISWLPLKDF